MVSVFAKIDERSCSTCSATPSHCGSGCCGCDGSEGTAGSTAGSLLYCISETAYKA